ncbi:MAG: phage holin family protein [Anaerolineae bacterium]|nr:phage holin family protein [Anaerolineae bacterium]
MKLLVRLIINAIALWAAVQLVPGLGYDGAPLTLVFVALIFGVVNALVRPLITLLTCPLIVATLGLFVLVINGIMLALTAWLSRLFDLGFYVENFWAALLGALVISIVSAILSLFVADDDR